MPAKYYLTFERDLAGKGIPEVFAGIQAWLAKEKAKVKSVQEPTMIDANHGTAWQMAGWQKDGAKRMVFQLSPSGDGTRAQVQIYPPATSAAVKLREEEARANWGELLADLWAQLGDTHAKSDAVVQPGVDWDKALADGKKWVMGGFVGSVLAAIVVVVFVIYFSRIPGGALGGVLLVPFLILAAGLAKVSSARKRKAIQEAAKQPGAERTG